jgi:hypothetical protein
MTIMTNAAMVSTQPEINFSRECMFIHRKPGQNDNAIARWFRNCDHCINLNSFVQPSVGDAPWFPFHRHPSPRRTSAISPLLRPQRLRQQSEKRGNEPGRMVGDQGRHGDTSR